MSLRGLLLAIIGLTAAIVVVPVPAEAQGGCRLQRLVNPAREILRCADGLRIEAETGATYNLFDRDRNGAPDGISLREKAVFIETAPGEPGRGFQVLTPQAIAAVRGTQWFVDVDRAGTAVFVLSGRVAVQRQGGRRAVSLGPGQGVDVDAGTAQLVVRRWPPARVSALLARFGR